MYIKTIYNFKYDESIFKATFKKYLDEAMKTYTPKTCVVDKLDKMADFFDASRELVSKNYYKKQPANIEFVIRLANYLKISVQDILLPNSQCESEGHLVRPINQYYYDCLMGIHKDADGVKRALKRVFYLIQKYAYSFLSYKERNELSPFIPISELREIVKGKAPEDLFELILDRCWILKNGEISAELQKEIDGPFVYETNAVMIENKEYDVVEFGQNLRKFLKYYQITEETLRFITKFSTGKVRNYYHMNFDFDVLPLPKRQDLVLFSQLLGENIDEFFIIKNEYEDLKLEDNFSKYLVYENFQYEISMEICDLKEYKEILDSYLSFRGELKNLIHSSVNRKQDFDRNLSILCNSLKVTYYEEEKFFPLYTNSFMLGDFGSLKYLNRYKELLAEVKDGEISPNRYLVDPDGFGLIVANADAVMLELIPKDIDIVLNYIKLLSPLELEQFYYKYQDRIMSNNHFIDPKNKILSFMLECGLEIKDSSGKNDYNALKNLLINILNR